MKKLELQQVEHQTKIGDLCGVIEPNVTEDCLFTSDGETVGFYLKSVDGKLKTYLEIANAELQSDRVPKSLLERKTPAGLDDNGNYKYNVVAQYSAILGSVPPKPMMRRNYRTISSVHASKTAQTFIKAMLLAVKSGETILHDIMPEQYERQAAIFSQVPDKWKFGNIFTSSISNCNISAPFHRDTGNFQNSVNIIFTKRHRSTGGSLNVPDYAATIEQADNSMLVYPAWRNVHGVTPIVPTGEGGYRNSLIFYPLKAFKNLQ